MTRFRQRGGLSFPADSLRVAVIACLLAAGLPIAAQAQTPSPYSGIAMPVPATFEAENFDRGGEGVAYHDNVRGNAGGQYRTSEDVDIVSSSDSAGGGYVVNNFETGEWLAYTINVQSAALYDIELRASTMFSVSAFHIEIDGKDVTGPITVPNTGGWSAFQWVGKKGVSLAAGQHVLKIVTDQQYFDLNSIRVAATLAPTPTPAPAPYTGTPMAVPGTFEAENFDRGGEGVAYHDNVKGNAGGQYRTSEDVDIIVSSDSAGGGYLVNNFETGEWLAYTVNVASSAQYDIELRASSMFSNSAFHIEIDGQNVTGTVTVPNTGSWSAFQWVGKQGVSLSAGRHVLKIVADQQYFDLNSVRVTSPHPAQAQELMPASANGWQAFAPRTQSAPGVGASSGSTGYALNIYGLGVPNVYGGWRTRITGLQGGNYYRFRARARPFDIASLRESVTIILRWSGSFAEGVMPDYVWDFRRQADGTIVFDRVVRAPGGTTAVDVDLVLQWSPGGQVALDELSFMAVDPPPPRKVRVAAIYYRPSGAGSGYESVRQAARYAEEVAINYRPDVIVLGEMLNVIGAPGTLDSNAETVPGPGTDLVAGVAATYRVNIAFGMLESSGSLLYNTAVLLDRNGQITGKYHKVQLPLSEASAGIAPGSSVPVFDTDFGRVALLICHDTSFPEPAREAALQGAELLLVPIWGGRPALVRARAVENGVYLAASGYDYASEVVSPLGAVLASATIDGGPTVAVADIDLSQRFPEAWLGDWRDASNKERRVEPYQFRVP